MQVEPSPRPPSPTAAPLAPYDGPENPPDHAAIINTASYGDSLPSGLHSNGPLPFGRASLPPPQYSSDRTSLTCDAPLSAVQEALESATLKEGAADHCPQKLSSKSESDSSLSPVQKAKEDQSRHSSPRPLARTSTANAYDSSTLDLLAGVADLLTRPRSRTPSPASRMDLDRAQSPDNTGRRTPSSLERANKPPHLHLIVNSSPSAMKANKVSQSVSGDAVQSSRSMQALSRFGILQPQMVQGRKMMVIGPHREGSEGQEPAYVLESRGDPLPPSVPRSLPPVNALSESSNYSASSGQLTGHTLSRHSSSASLEQDSKQTKRPRSQTVNLPSISQLFPGDECRPAKMQRINSMQDHSLAQSAKTNRPRSLSDVVVSQQGRKEPSFLRPGHRLALPVPGNNNFPPPRPPVKAPSSSADHKPRPPPKDTILRPTPLAAANLPASHAHNSATKRFRCPLYSCGGKLAPHQSKVKASLLKCQDCARVYWQNDETTQVDESLCPCYGCHGRVVIFDDKVKNLRLHGCNQCRLVFCVQTASAVFRSQGQVSPKGLKTKR